MDYLTELCNARFLYKSDVWCLRENKMTFLKTERSMQLVENIAEIMHFNKVHFITATYVF